PAMMELKAALTPYINLTSWTATNPCSSWWLITCWTNGLVRRMDISSKAIQGNLPSVIGSLTSLDEFFATTNWLKGPLPDSFSRLTAIRNLQLFKNYFEGPIPDSWGNMKNLVQLHLNLNYFSGGLPDTFSQLTNMQKFYVSSNLLNSSFPTVVCTMKNLRELRLSYNHFTGSVPSCLSQLSYLYYLYIDTNQLTGSLPATIGDLPALQNLFINQNSLSGPLPPIITKLTNLRILFMSSNPYLDGPLPSDLGNMVSLTDFVMEFAAFNGTIPDSISKLTRLSRILMDNCRFTGSIPQGISNLKALTVMYLEGNRFRGSFPAGLLTLPKLNLLNLHDNQFSGPLPSGFLNATIVTAGQINIHHNYFNGPATIVAGASPFCPKDQTRNGIFYQSSLAYNCIKYPATSACALAPRIETQLSTTTCQAFCGADVAPCGGHGTCWFGVGRSVSCDCDPGYVPTLDGLSCVADTTGVVFVDSLTSRVIPTLDGTKRLTIGVYQIYQKFHRDLPATKQYAYGTSQKTASYPGPTIVAKVGIDTTVTWENHLLDNTHMFTVDRTVMMGIKLPRKGIPIVVHRHGGSQQSFYDGHPLAWFTQYGEKGPTYYSSNYKYVNDEASTVWYHDHMAGMTRLNVAAGMAGLYIITDPKVESKFTWLPPATRTIPLAIADRLFFANGSINYPNVGIVPNVHPNWIPEYLGDTNMVNGVVWPYLKVRPALYRFKVLGASNARFYNLQFVCAQRGDYPNFVPPLTGKVLEMIEIASDGGYQEKPVYMTSLLLTPGARHDILVDFSNLPSSCKDVILQNTARAPYPGGIAADRDTGLVMRIVITNRGRFPAPKIPSRISYVPRINFRDIQKVRWHRLVEEMDPKTNQPIRVTIDNLGFMNPVRDFPKQGTNEIWHIINLSADAHPFHIHLIDHRPIARRAFDVAAFQAGRCSFRKSDNKPACWTSGRIPVDPTERGWKDTTPAYPGQVLTLWTGWKDNNGRPLQFDASVGPGYVYHCHMLEHEDNDMMRPFKIVPNGKAE
ncbi:unnamed protein product, partial [Closterium sp. Yama58-4]